MECKLVLVGTKGTGKGALAIRFSHGYFMENYDPTVEDSYRKRLNIDNKEVSVELQKVSAYEPNEGFSNGQQIRDASGFVLVYSVGDSASHEAITVAKSQIEKVKGNGFVPMVICGAKSDLPASDRKVDKAQGAALGKQLSLPFYEASAQSGEGVDELFNSIVNLVLNGAPKSNNGGGANNAGGGGGGGGGKKKGCCIVM